jgi:hypothetical protein
MPEYIVTTHLPPPEKRTAAQRFVERIRQQNLTVKKVHDDIKDQQDYLIFSLRGEVRSDVENFFALTQEILGKHCSVYEVGLHGEQKILLSPTYTSSFVSQQQPPVEDEEYDLGVVD